MRAAAWRFVRGVPASAWAAALLFIVASAAITAASRGERSGWTLMTSPAGYDHRTNTLLGYCWLYAGGPFMKENIPCVSQVGLFAGSREALSGAEYRDDFRLIRGFYGFAASLLEPFFGIVGAMLAVNWLSWAVCAAVAYDLTGRLSGSNAAAMLATALVAAGIGPVIHIGDYSPHLLAFATYYAGVWLLVWTRVAEERRPFRVHLALGLYLAVCCLTYNTGVMLLAVYGVAAALKNRWRHLATAAVIALSSRPLWQAVLGPGVTDVEAEYLSRSLEKWREVLGGGPALAVKTAAHFTSEIVLFFDSPGVVLAGLACCAIVPMSAARRRLGLAAVGFPLLAAFVFAPSATARGYLVYAASVWVYCCLATALAGGFRSGRKGVRGAAVAAAAGLLLGSHLLWATAHLWGHLGPAKTYFLGWDDGLAYFTAPTEVVSLTGREPSPVLFGGEASLTQAGAVTSPGDRQLNDVSFDFALLSRAFFAAYLVVLALVAAGTWRRRAAAASAVLGCLALTAGLSTRTLRSIPAFFPVDQAVTVPAGGSLRYEVALSSEAAGRLRTMSEQGDTLGFFFRLYAPAAVEVSVSADGEELLVVRDPDPDYNSFYRFEDPDRERGVEVLSRAKRLTFIVHNPTGEPVMLAGWQRRDSLGRTAAVTAPSGTAFETPQALPAFELRLADSRGHLKFAAF